MRARTHWTPSSLKDFETCPAKYHYTYHYELADWRALGYDLGPVKRSEAADRGTAIHLTCEHYLDPKNGPEVLHKDINRQWRNMLAGLKDLGAVPEQQWEFEEGWHPKEDGPLWLRMKIDAHYRINEVKLKVIDYKTGKAYRENMEQVEVYALGAFAKFDDIDEVQGELWYFDSDEPHEKTFKRSQAAKLARKWEQRAGAALGAVKYLPRQNFFCKWCPFNQRNGGPCTHAA